MFKIAFRNIFRQKRRTFLTILMMFGGFTLSSISIGWSDGAYANIVNIFTRNRLGHIQVHRKSYIDKPSIYDTINNYSVISEKILSVKRIIAWSPRLYSAGLVSIGDKSAGVQIIGIDPILEKKATLFDKKISRGKPLPEKPSQLVLLGIGLAKILDAVPGNSIVLVSQSADGSIANDVYVVSGLVDMDDEMSNRTGFYMNIKEAQTFLSLENQAHELIIILDNIKYADSISRKIREILNSPGLAVETWQEFAKSFYQAMLADQQGMWISIVVIILIVAVGVLNTVLMSVLERTREYGLLKALGTRPKQIILLVLYEVIILVIFGIILGSVMGFILNYIFSIYGIKLPAVFTYGGMKFGVMYSEINARSFYIPAITVFISAVLVSIFPALRASHVDPAKSMKTH